MAYSLIFLNCPQFTWRLIAALSWLPSGPLGFPAKDIIGQYVVIKPKLQLYGLGEVLPKSRLKHQPRDTDQQCQGDLNYQDNITHSLDQAWSLTVSTQLAKSTTAQEVKEGLLAHT